MITADCCKRLSMLSKTKKAEEVRTYFIEVEKLMNKYKDYIIDSLNKKGVFQKIIKKQYQIIKIVLFIFKRQIKILLIYIKLEKTKIQRTNKNT